MRHAMVAVRQTVRKVPPRLYPASVIPLRKWMTAPKINEGSHEVSPHLDQTRLLLRTDPNARPKKRTYHDPGALRTLATPMCWPLSNGFSRRSQESSAHH